MIYDSVAVTMAQNYDRYLGPLFFYPYADDLVARLPVRPGVRVLEIACGTGIVTARLWNRLRGQGTLVATDLNESMLAYAQTQVSPAAGLEWRKVDATNLPFPDVMFDAVVCEFGLMFFPDKAASAAEAFRVLQPGGHWLFNVWDAVEHNRIGALVHETVAAFFPTDPPQFFRAPFAYHDAPTITALLERAGFERIQWEYVEKTGTSPSATDAATGLIDGAPIGAEIIARRADAVPEIKAAVAAKIAAELGDPPVPIPLRALVFSARRPADGRHDTPRAAADPGGNSG